MSWAQQRRNKYILGFFVILVIIIGVPAYFLLQTEPSCKDNVQNQGEEGVDCGGPCEVVCNSHVGDLNILWSRSFKVTDGVYNAVAYVENPNFKAGIRSIPYTFKLRDKENLIVSERLGSTYVPPGVVVPVFEASIKTGNRKPVRTTFHIDEEKHRWVDFSEYEKPLNVSSIKRELDRNSPRIKAQIKNTSVEKIENSEIVAVVFNENGNAIGASKTFIPSLAGGETTSVAFTWPRPFGQNITKVDIKARVPLPDK